MDRVTVFPLQLPLETDLLRSGQFAMVGLAAMAETVLGTATVADGFAIAPTAPASLSVVLGPGRVYQRAQLENSPWSSIPVDFRPILKQGIALDPTTIPLSPPATVNYAVNYLIQVSYSDKDDEPAVRPFYNAANPSQPFAGPGNNGTASPQARKGIAQILPKAGPAAPIGSQLTPDPDPGWIGLYVVTVPNGTVGITSGNIATYRDAPFVIAKLPEVPRNVQANTWTSFFDTSATPNLITGSPIPALKAYAAPTSLRVVVGNTNTGPVKLNVSGLGLQDLTRRNATPLLPADIVAGQVITITHDGLRWRLDSLAQGEVPRVVASPILWVRTDGSDLNDGSDNTPTKAFKTLDAALAFGTSQIAYAGTQLQVILGIPGTYAAPKTAGSIGGAQTLLGGVGSVLIMSEAHRLGDLTQQDNYTIQGSGFANNSGILHPSFGTYLVLQGLTVQNNSSGFNTLTVSTNAVVYCQYVTFGGLPGGAGAAHFFTPDGGQIRIGPGCKITNSMGYMIHTNGGGVTINGTIKLLGAINYGATVFSETAGRVIIATGIPFDISAATVTGQRYIATLNGVISSVGQGANAFPGNSAGVIANGGVYV